MPRMRTWTYKQMVEVVESNGYEYSRCTGDHVIYKKQGARNTITLTKKRQINPCIARRLIKENNLVLS